MSFGWAEAANSLVQLGSAWMQADAQTDINNQQLQFARENRDWQERMANTAHQREVQDLQAAGLNPILSVSRGGAVTPSGASTPDLKNPYAGLTSTASELLRIWNETRKVDSDIASAEQDRRIKTTAEKGSAMVGAGLDAISEGAKSVGESIAPLLKDAQDWLSERFSDVSAASAQAVERVGGAASSAAGRAVESLSGPVSVDKVLGRAVGSALSAAGITAPRTAERLQARRQAPSRVVPASKLKAGSFSGDPAKDHAAIDAIRDPIERRNARRSYNLWLHRNF